MKHTRIIAAAALAFAVLGGGVASAHDHRHGDSARTFTLRPDPASNPEGVAADGRTFYVSDTGSGSIYRGELGSPTVTPFITNTGGSAVGLKVAHGNLYVAGGATGKITVYDLRTKRVVESYDTGTGGFLNDLVVLGHDIYVTDSQRPTLWHVDHGKLEGIDISKEIPYTTGFNLNGIVEDRGDLVVVQSNTGKLFRIDRHDYDAGEITGVNLPGGDGMLIDAGKLVVVQGNPAQLSFVKLKRDRAELRGTRTSPLLKGPSTIARAKDTYLVVNADFATSAKPFTVAGLPR